MDGVIDRNGHAFFPVYRYIAQVPPSSFVLGNVSTLPVEFPDTFFFMVKMLQEIMEGAEVA
eukprot:3841033-Lingulodinium_polyedra.AAC.1